MTAKESTSLHGRLAPGDLERISAQTLESYTQRAEAFREGTRDHDVRQNIDALLRHIETPPPSCILDFGCGPGRDLATFAQLGHLAIGLEVDAELATVLERQGCADRGADPVPQAAAAAMA